MKNTMKRILCLLSALLLVGTMTACTETPTDKQTTPITPTTTTASNETLVHVGGPDFLDFNSFEEVTKTLRLLERGNESLVSDYANKASIMWLPYIGGLSNERDTLVSWLQQLSTRPYFVFTEDSSWTLQNIHARFYEMDETTVAFTYYSTDDTVVRVSHLPLKNETEISLPSNDAVVGSVTVDGQTMVFEKTEDSDSLLGTLVIDGYAVQLTCTNNALSVMKTEAEAGRLRLSTIADITVDYRYTSFSSLGEIAALKNAANGTDAEAQTYLQENPIDGIATKADLQALSETIDQLEFWYLDEDGFEFQCIDYTRHINGDTSFELYFKTADLTASTTSSTSRNVTPYNREEFDELFVVNTTTVWCVDGPYFFDGYYLTENGHIQIKMGPKEYDSLFVEDGNHFEQTTHSMDELIALYG